MNTKPELIREAQSCLNGMDNRLNSILDYCSLIGLVLASPDFEDECTGLHRLVSVMREHAWAISMCHHQAEGVIHRLSNP
jgi:hypothetical protein